MLNCKHEKFMGGVCINCDYIPFSKNKHAQQLGKLGGQVKSEAKTKAARINGKKGGRPKIIKDEN